jgi:Fe-S-cluster containining protein
MAGERVVRPIVRAFRTEFEKEAAAHVRAGGHAFVWESAPRKPPSRAVRGGRLVFAKPRGRLADDLGYWALLDLGLTRWSTVTRGPLRGLASARIPADCVDIVQERVERDSIHPGSTRTMHLDCEECAACCRDNRVEIHEADLARFRRAGRPELGRAPYVRKDGGKLVLRLLRSGDCRNLTRDKRCAIYELRPDSCRSFPRGSEGCLFSREEELGVVDGLSIRSPGGSARTTTGAGISCERRSPASA